MSLIQSISELVKLGFSGTAVALAILAYRLIMREQERGSGPRKDITAQIRNFMRFALSLAVIIAVMTGLEMIFLRGDSGQEKDKLGGCWIQLHDRRDDKTTCSYVLINYDERTSSYSMSGRTFQMIDDGEAQDYKMYAYWRTEKVEQINETHEIAIKFEYVADLYDIALKKDPDRPRRVTGTGEVSFVDENGIYRTGDGYYLNEKNERTIFRISRIEADDFPDMNECDNLTKEKLLVEKYLSMMDSK